MTECGHAWQHVVSQLLDHT